MGWMNDTLRYMRHEPIHRQYHQDELTFSLIYAFHENFVLPLSHDEVVHGKRSLLDQMPGDLWQKFANLRLLYSYMWTHPGKKLLYMGGEFGQWSEWNNDASLQWDLLQWDTHSGLQRCMSDLNRIVREQPALHEVDFDHSGFEWIDCHNYQDSILCYVRQCKKIQKTFSLSAAITHQWHDKTTDSECQAAAGIAKFSTAIPVTTVAEMLANFPGKMAEPINSHGRPFSLELTLPPLGVIVLKPE